MATKAHKRRQNCIEVSTDSAPAPLAAQLFNLQQMIEDLSRSLYGQRKRETQPRLFTVVEQGHELPPMNEIDLAVWQRAPVNLLVDLTRYIVRLRTPGAGKVREISFGSDNQGKDKLGGPVLDVLRILAEHPGVRMTPMVTGELTDTVTSPTLAKQHVYRLRSRLGLSEDEAIVTEKSVTRSLPGPGPVYYADPNWTWRVIRYADWLSRK